MNNDRHKDLVHSATQAIIKAMQEWSAAQPIEHAFAEKLLAQIDALSFIRLAMLESFGVSIETLEKIQAKELEVYKLHNGLQF